ncbi:MAG: CYTH domain-containing protein [Nanoarchaeota archaeon]|nr:CYTH domain-containing protein [Nanoarchaeota archaeon]
MVFEVEKKFQFLQKEEKDAIMERLSIDAKYIGSKIMHSFIFQAPNYLRVRLSEHKITVTHKSGEPGDIARKETDLTLADEQLIPFLSLLEALGYVSCTHVMTKRDTFIMDGLTVETNEIDGLGFFAEIEGLTENKDEVNSIIQGIDRLKSRLRLEEVDKSKYKSLLNEFLEKNREVMIPGKILSYL